MSRFLLPGALVLAMLALAACGGAQDAPDAEVDPGADGDPVAVYEETVRAVNATVRSASERLADDTVDPAELETELEEASRRLDQSTPPYDVLPEHQRLSQAIGQAVDLAAGIGAAGEPRPTAEVEQLRQALAEAEEALADLEEKGYDVRRT